MHYFLPQIKSFIQHNSRVLEIRADQGLVSQVLLDSFPDLKLEIVEPFSLDDNVRSNPRVTSHNGLSLEILPELLWQFDLILINGDHNYFTVFNELKLIDALDLLKKDGQIFIHDISWPNGVMCAIIDWLSTKPNKDYDYQEINKERGLGILTKLKTTLTDLAIKYDSDKFGSHDYTRIYEEKLRPLQNDPISLLEIGIFDGASLKMWQDYFTQASILLKNLK